MGKYSFQIGLSLLSVENPRLADVLPMVNAECPTGVRPISAGVVGFDFSNAGIEGLRQTGRDLAELVQVSSDSEWTVPIYNSENYIQIPDNLF